MNEIFLFMHKNNNNLNEKDKKKVLFCLGGFSKNPNQECGLEI